MSEEWIKKPAVIVALGIAGAAVLAALLWGLSEIIPALGVAVGLAISVSATGLATASGLAPWVAPLATVGVGVTGASAAYIVIITVGEKVKQSPYVWTIPLLSITAGLLADLCKEFFFDNKIAQIVFTTIVAFMLLVGGYLLTKKPIGLRAFGVVLPLLPSVFMLANLVVSNKGDQFTNSAKALSGTDIIGIAGLFVISLILVIFGLMASDMEQGEKQNSRL
jgi:hypothetical protein